MLLQESELVIRNATAADAPLLGNWWRDGEVMAHAGFPNGVDVTDEKIAADIARGTDEAGRVLIIEAHNIPIGEMNYHNAGNGIAEIGIKICETSQQGKDYGTRLIKMLVGSLFCDLGYSKIVLDTNLNNPRAQHVYEKCGFRRIRVNVDAWKDQLGEWQSSVDYELTKETFRS